MLLMVDEEYRRMSTVQEYLEKYGYTVNLIDNVDDAMDFIKSKYNLIDAIILDLMMPWGKLFSKEESEYGLLTGYLLFKKIRKEYGHSKPIIIYTAVNRAELINTIKKQENCYYIPKDKPAFKIITKLEELGVHPLR